MATSTQIWGIPGGAVNDTLFCVNFGGDCFKQNGNRYADFGFMSQPRQLHAHVVLPQSQGVFGGSAFFGLIETVGITTHVLHVDRLASDT